MSDFAFLDRDQAIDAIAARRERYESVLREGFANKAKWLQNDVEQLQDYTRNLMRAGFDATEELNELETFANGLMLVALLLKREASKG